MLIAVALGLAVLLGVIAGLALTRDTNTDVPDVTGLPEPIARNNLESQGFKVVETTTRVGRKGYVQEQDPVGGQEASLDCALITFFCSKPTITLSVSEGPGSAAVPNLRGLSRAGAKRALEKSGFRAAFVSEPSSSVPEGQVISTDPLAGANARRGSLVTVTVSRGPRQVTVPAVVGRSSAAAKQAIRGRGLNYAVSFAESGKPAGTVLSQSPDAGTRVGRGDTVAIVVSQGVQKVSVPNVIGEKRSNAVSALRGAGFSVTVNLQDTTVPAQDGRVTDQFPAPGAARAKGSAVTIFVGRLTAAPVTPTSPTTTTPAAP
jgi:serine/threonine-protein kinase